MTSAEIPLILPEKLAMNKALLELEPRDGNSTDLAGDAGAVHTLTLNFKSILATLARLS